MPNTSANTRYTTPPPADFVPAWRAVFERQKAFAEHAFAQLDDPGFFRVPAEGLNSVAVIAQHIAGNLVSRFTDFLTTDGEKPWRDRESEFAPPEPTAAGRAQLMARWDAAWQILYNELDALTPADLSREVPIRGVPHAVHAALARAIDHYAFHIGQINVIARLHVGTANWKWFTLAPGASKAFNASLGHTPGA
ncbi:MAG: DUF1572 family protein [Phycisphaerales bacterium]